MSICRVNKQPGRFVQIDKTVLEDTNLSAKAKGLHAYLMCHANHWEVRISYLVKQFKDGRDSIYAGIKELREHHYVLLRHPRSTSGSYDKCYYEVYETKQLNPENPDTVISPNPKKTENSHTDPADLPDTGNPDTAKPYPEKPDVNNNKINKNNLNKNKAAARGDSGKSDNSALSLPSLAAAAFSSTDTPLLDDDLQPLDQTNPANTLGSTLTPEQTNAVVMRFTRALLEDVRAIDPSTTMEQAVADVADYLLSPTTFKHCGRDFHWKLNAIIEQIMAHRWTPLRLQRQATAEANAASALNDKRRALDTQIRTLKLDIHGDEQQLPAFKASLSDNPEGFALIERAVNVKRQQLATLADEREALGPITPSGKE